MNRRSMSRDLVVMPAGDELDVLIAVHLGVPQRAYSTDLAAALLIVASLNRCGFFWDISQAEDARASAQIEGPGLLAYRWSGDAYHQPSLPLAICRAVLKALGVDSLATVRRTCAGFKAAKTRSQRKREMQRQAAREAA